MASGAIKEIDEYLESISRADKKLNFNLALLSKLCDNELSPFSLHHQDAVMTEFWINGVRVNYTATTRGLQLSLKPGTYNLKIQVVIDYDTDLSIVKALGPLSKTPNKRFTKTVEKAISVTIDETADCYVVFAAYLRIGWNNRWYYSIGDFYNSDFSITHNWEIVKMQDAYDFVKTNKASLDGVCSYWYGCCDKHKYNPANLNAVKNTQVYTAETPKQTTVSSTNTSSTVTSSTVKNTYSYNTKPTITIKPSAPKTPEPPKEPTYKPIHNVGTVSVSDLSYDEKIKFRNDAIKMIKQMNLSKNTGHSSFIVSFGALNLTYYKLSDKLIKKQEKEFGFKLRVEYNNYSDGSKYIGFKNKGTFFKINGEVYEGERPGKGRYIYPNGDIYECECSGSGYKMGKKL